MPDLVQLSPPYSPWRSENEESSPSSHVITLRDVQLDGGRDESLSDETISQEGGTSLENEPGMHREIEDMGKKAIGKAKEITSKVAEELQTDTKGVSPYQASPRGADEIAPSKQSADATCVERSPSEEGPCIHQGTASSRTFRSTQTEENIKGLAPEPRAVVDASENSLGSFVVDRSDTPKKSPASNLFTEYGGCGSMDAMQNHDTDYSEAKLQEGHLTLQRPTSTSSDATALQSLRDHPDMERRFPASQEATKGCGAGLSDITNVRKPKAKKQDDESKAQRRTSQTKCKKNKDEMSAASGDMQT